MFPEGYVPFMMFLAGLTFGNILKSSRKRALEEDFKLLVNIFEKAEMDFNDEMEGMIELSNGITFIFGEDGELVDVRLP